MKWILYDMGNSSEYFLIPSVISWLSKLVDVPQISLTQADKICEEENNNTKVTKVTFVFEDEGYL